MNINDLFNKKAEKVTPKKEKVSLVDILCSQIEKENVDVYPPNNELTLRASGIGGCPRANAYKQRGWEDKKNAKSAITLEFGTAVHEILQKYLQNSGVLESLEVRAYMLDELSGSYDGILNYQNIGIDAERELLEIKTMNHEAYMRQVQYGKIYPKYIKQAHCYMHEHGLKSARFLFVNKSGMLSDDFLKECPDANPIFHEQILKFDPKIWEEVKEIVEDQKVHFAANTLPDRVKKSECSYCPFELDGSCKRDWEQEKIAKREQVKEEKEKSKSDKPVSRKPRKPKNLPADS